MKINVDKNVVEFTPENAQETASLELLWKVVVDCDGNNKKIVPMGLFVPGHDTLARFHIEGIKGGVTTYSDDTTAPADNTYYCSTCNKYMNVKTGEGLPQCCGRDMEVMN
ncbi:MAG: hypothetical protein PF495_16260 [Spirochaetales bacterium]|jgi:hypothetical protein|nr:hypothetical protein [Spirochaetales bacterium]